MRVLSAMALSAQFLWKLVGKGWSVGGGCDQVSACAVFHTSFLPALMDLTLE